MTERQGKSIRRADLGRGLKVTGAALVLLWAAAALAQEPPVQQGQPGQDTYPQTEQPAETPAGPLDALGRWIGKSVSTAGAGINAAWRGTITGIGGIGTQAGTAAKGAGEAATTVAKGAADVAKGAATGAAEVASTAARLPGSHIATGRERCTIAPNGAPDCRAAAVALCKSKSFNGGTSVEFEDVENCPASVLLAGKRPEERSCPTEYFVTKSLCQ